MVKLHYLQASSDIAKDTLPRSLHTDYSYLAQRPPWQESRFLNDLDAYAWPSLPKILIRHLSSFRQCRCHLTITPKQKLCHYLGTDIFPCASSRVNWVIIAFYTSISELLSGKELNAHIVVRLFLKYLLPHYVHVVAQQPLRVVAIQAM